MRALFPFLLLVQTVRAASLPVPTTGIYLGIWPNPDLANDAESALEIREGSGPNGINHPFYFHLVYYSWTDIQKQLSTAGVFQPDKNLAGDISHGRVPVITWGCDN